MTKVTLLVGNPKPASRTLQVAEALARRIVPGDAIELDVIDLTRFSDKIFAWPSETMAELMARLVGSDLAIIASPTYKATYTGLLKAFLDRYPKDGLGGLTTIPLMTGADLTHAIAPEVHLRPLLVELGADVPTRSLYFVTSAMDRMEQVLDEWLDENRARLVRASTIIRPVDA